MIKNLIAKKIGMSQKFLNTGVNVPVTLLHVEDNFVISKKENSVTLGTNIVNENRINKPQREFLKKHKLPMTKTLHEFKCKPNDSKQGDAINLDIFKDIKFIDATAFTKGKGFSGGIKRHNFKMKRATHGVSVSHRSLGSTGQCQDPGRVFKNKKMAGQYGNEKCTIQNLQIIEILDKEKIVLVKGAVPGPKGGKVILKKAIKKGDKK